MIFECYLELGSVHALVRQLEIRGVKSKLRTNANGKATGGQPFSRGALFHLLRNRIYIGEIVHKGEFHAGLHDAIVPRQLFEKVQQMLTEHARARTSRRRATAPLAGKLFLADGRRLTPTHSRGANGKAYRYYVPNTCQTGRAAPSDIRLPAAQFEARLRSILQRAATDGPDGLQTAIRIEVHVHQILIDLPASHLAAVRKALADNEQADIIDRNLVRWAIPWTSPRKGCATLGHTRSQARRDPVLIKALRSAHAILEHDRKGRPFLPEVPACRYQRRLARLAFLSPHIQAAIIEGRQPIGLTLEDLVRNPLPIDWDEQERFIASLAAR